MKKTFTVFMAIAGIAVFTDRAGALPISSPFFPEYQDIDAIGVTLNAREAAGDTFNLVTGDIDLVTGDPESITIGDGYINAGSVYSDLAGFVPGGVPKTILSAKAYFYISGLQDGSTHSVLMFDLTDWLVDWADPAATTDGNDAQFILGGALGSGLITVLNNTGELAYQVTCDEGSFNFDYAQLQVDMTGDAYPTPDSGSTAGMLGWAFLAVGALAKKLNVRKA